MPNKLLITGATAAAASRDAARDILREAGRDLGARALVVKEAFRSNLSYRLGFIEGAVIASIPVGVAINDAVRAGGSPGEDIKRDILGVTVIALSFASILAYKTAASALGREKVEKIREGVKDKVSEFSGMAAVSATCSGLAASIAINSSGTYGIVTYALTSVGLAVVAALKGRDALKAARRSG